MSEALIERIYALKNRIMESLADEIYVEALEDCVDIIRQYNAEQPKGAASQDASSVAGQTSPANSMLAQSYSDLANGVRSSEGARAALIDYFRDSPYPESQAGGALLAILPFLQKPNLFHVGWHRGFPPEAGMYLVELADGEMVVTPWNDGTGNNRDTWGDERRTGWCCLTDSHSTVKRWIKASALAALPTREVDDETP